MAIRVQDILWVRTLQRGSQFPDKFSGYFTGVKLVDHDTLMATFTDERDLRVVNLVSKDNGFTWTEWATLHDSARDLVGWNGMGTAQGLFKSGIGSPSPGFASIGVDWTAFTFIVGPQPAAGGIFTAELKNHHHWKKVWDGLIIPYNVSVPWADFGITCGWANLPNARLACGEYAADDIHPAYFPDGLFYLVKTQSSSGRSGWTPHGGDARLYLEDWPTNSFNLDGIMTVYPVINHPHPLLGNDRTILAGAHMTSRRPRMFWNLEGGYGGIRESSLASDQFNRRVSNWHEVRLPPTLGTFEEFLFSTYVNSFAHLGNGVILAGGGAPTIVPGDEQKPFGSRTYYHFPQLWRSNNPAEDPLDTWENISLNIGHFATTLPISGPTQYRVNEVLSLGDGNAVLGLYVRGPNDYPFWFTNDYGDSFPSPGIFSRPEVCDFQIVNQMTLTPAGFIAASMFVSYVDQPGFWGEVWIGIPLILIVQGAFDPARSVGMMEQREFMAGLSGLGSIPAESNPWPPGETCSP